MSREEHYFNFPLIALHGEKGFKKEKTPEHVINTCLDCGIVNAGIGYRVSKGDEEFQEVYTQAIEERISKGLGHCENSNSNSSESVYIVGCKIANVTCSYSEIEMAGIVHHFRNKELEHYRKPPYVRMKASFMWNALNTARHNQDPISKERPEQRISWNEFRVLCAILSAKVNIRGFAMISVNEIRARACGFINGKALKKAKTIPHHLAPPLSEKQIRKILIDLEKNRFFIKFRHSTGTRGGLSAYSFRHDTRAALGESVGQWDAFKKGLEVKANREKDLQISLENRAKYNQQNLDL